MDRKGISTAIDLWVVIIVALVLLVLAILFAYYFKANWAASLIDKLKITLRGGGL